MRRPRVVVYVTREHPATGADQLLVFDAVDDPQFTAVVPGGGIEPDETVDEAVVREVLEETGIDVRPVRRLAVVEQQGRFRDGLLHESHFVQAVPTEPVEDEWGHRITGRGAESGTLVRCRWVAVGPDAELWGNRAQLVGELVRRRVVAYVTREREGRTELLVFDHEGMPEVPTQVPAGRIEAHESFEEGLLREVEEETGLSGLQIVSELADAREFEQLFGPGAHESHAFHAVAEAEGPDAWEHPVTGTGMDAGLVFLCRWVPLADCPPLWGEADPLAEELRRSMTKT